MFERTSLRASVLVLLMVPALSACGSWTDDYKRGAEALKQNKFDDAEHYLLDAQQAARTARSEQGLAVSTLGLARVHLDQGEFGEARPLLEQTVRQFQTLYGRNSAQVAETLVELSACLYQQQMYAQAEPLCLEAIEIESSLKRPNIQTMGTAYNNLAEICKNRDETTRAGEYYQKAIAVYKSDKAGSSKGLVDTYCNLAMLYKSDEQYEFARAAADEAMKAEQALAKPNDLALASVLNTVASIDIATFDLESAKAAYQKAVAALRRHERTSSDYEEALCDTLDNLGDLYQEERDNRVAENTYLESVTHCIHSRGPNHPCVAERMVDLGNLYRHTDRLPQAEDMFRKALAIYSVSYDSESPIVINTINDLSAVYLDEKKYTEANRLYENWIPKLKKELGPVHPHVADALENWALVADQSAESEVAKDLRAQAKGIRLALTTKK